MLITQEDYDLDFPTGKHKSINASGSKNNGIYEEDLEIALIKAQQIEMLKEKIFQEKIRIKWCLQCKLKFPGDEALRKHVESQTHKENSN